ncbi:MAG: serine protease [Alphaproteobacteria bacterium]|nr:serine protease [Alphaproteobacteria bacterium]
MPTALEASGALLPLVVPRTFRCAGRVTPDAPPVGLAAILAAVLTISAHVPSSARTAEALGTQREGTGIVIDEDGLVLTIGYLIVEAETVSLLTGHGVRVPAHVVGYDHETGFGLVRANRPLDVAPLAIGDSDLLLRREPVVLVSAGGPGAVTGGHVVSRREFAGYWEYLLPNAIFTTPPHDNWAGAALIGRDGKLAGVGSLMVNNALPEDRPLPGNMFVPISALAPVLGDLVAHGRPLRRQRPWLGLFAAESLGRLVVTRVSPDAPAEAAGVRAGDVVLSVGGAPVNSLREFLRRLWSMGDAGVDVQLSVLSETAVREVTVRSGSRLDYLQTFGRTARPS